MPLLRLQRCRSGKAAATPMRSPRRAARPLALWRHMNTRVDATSSPLATDALADSAAPRPLPSSSSSSSTTTSTSTTTTTLANAHAYCRNRVHALDHDGYLASLFFPGGHRVRAVQWTLRALNVELAQVREQTTQDQIGRMRLQWWRDAVHQTFEGHPPNHPVTVALGHHLHVEGLRLSKSWLLKMISARESNLATLQFPTLDALETYAEQAFSSLLYLQLESLGLRHMGLDHLASHLGKMAGMVAFVRGVPVQALQGRFYLPADVCARHGLSAEDAYRAVRLRVARNGGDGTSGKASAPSLNDLDVDARERYERSAIALHNVIYDLASHAHRHVNTARDHLANADLRPAVPADDLARAWPVLMQAYPSVRFLESLEREAQFDVVHPAVVGRGGEWSLPLRMWLQNRRRVL